MCVSIKYDKTFVLFTECIIDCIMYEICILSYVIVCQF